MFPNGHTIAAVEVPVYTLFYHGRLDGELPPSPEWLAFDVEMSYGIMGSTRNSWLLTYQTTRPVRALCFDGESAALMGLGQLDTQMLHVFGNVSGPPRPRDGVFRGLWQEYARAEGLCDWLLAAGLRGPGWGFEGVVRMNAGFEMIWCDFTSPSLRLLTQLNITAPQLPEDERNGFDPSDPDRRADENEIGDDGPPAWLAMQQRGVEAETTSYYSLPPAPTRTDRAVDPSQPPAPPNWRRDMQREPFLKAQGWGWFDSATWHYGSSRNGPGLGETRAKVLGCGVLSYYSPRFVNQSGNRAIEERAFLNLTDDGLWKGEGEEGNRTQAIKLLSRRRRFHHLGGVASKRRLELYGCGLDVDYVGDCAEDYEASYHAGNQVCGIAT
ncbi:putative serine protein [Phaeoacremonium minimum UCRPA7]|uniref:Putative serine protein n=1 Tax=Phaeoacremonium minimum (strain UCR-PA7) TaxID=1286976 RepID=R8BMA0_PHAM7|nr:putative serine protein [Phaeoacremonium minimum UCRPA7]EOO00489.1 putative serine protein [Phaeoacremonium minimum UCRPA7]